MGWSQAQIEEGRDHKPNADTICQWLGQRASAVVKEPCLILSRPWSTNKRLDPMVLQRQACFQYQRVSAREDIDTR